MITGTREPKFVDQSSNTVLLEYGKIIANEPIYRSIEQESVLNNYINDIHIGVHWNFTVRIHLYKQGGGTAITKYQELISYLGSDVYVWQHKEGNAFQDSDGDNVLFRVKEVTPAYFETADFKDIIIISFRSKNLIDMSKMTLAANTIWVKKGDKIYPMTDSSGNVQTYGA